MTLQQEREQAERKRWEDLGFHSWSGDALTIFGAVTAAHKAAHKGVWTTFWDARCSECGWKARLMVWEGNPFDPIRNGRFALAVGNILYIQPKAKEA